MRQDGRDFNSAAVLSEDMRFFNLSSLLAERVANVQVSNVT